MIVAIVAPFLIYLHSITASKINPRVEPYDSMREEQLTTAKCQCDMAEFHYNMADLNNSESVNLSAHWFEKKMYDNIETNTLNINASWFSKIIIKRITVEKVNIDVSGWSTVEFFEAAKKIDQQNIKIRDFSTYKAKNITSEKSYINASAFSTVQLGACDETKVTSWF